MNLKLRRTFAASAASLIVLAGAACSNETEGEGSPGSSSSASESAESESSESSSESSSGSESSSAESSQSDGPAGSETSTDGAFTYSVPSGYTEATDKATASSAVAAVLDQSGSGDFATNIVTTSESAQGQSLDTAADAVIAQIEKNLGATAEPSDGFPLDSVDGEELLALTTDEYEQSGQELASAVVLTVHDDTLYAFIVNTAADQKSSAGSKLIEFVETVKWT